MEHHVYMRGNVIAEQQLQSFVTGCVQAQYGVESWNRTLWASMKAKEQILTKCFYSEYFFFHFCVYYFVFWLVCFIHCNNSNNSEIVVRNLDSCCIHMLSLLLCVHFNCSVGTTLKLRRSCILLLRAFKQKTNSCIEYLTDSETQRKWIR